MKRIFQFFHSATALLLMAIAVMVSACSESEENTPPPPPDPVVPSILMADSLVSVPAEGGSFAVEAKVANPVEGETLSAACHNPTQIDNYCTALQGFFRFLQRVDG